MAQAGRLMLTEVGEPSHVPSGESTPTTSYSTLVTRPDPLIR